MSTTEQTAHLSLAQTLEQTLASKDANKGISIGELADSVGDKGFGLLLIVLALPSALPVPAPGYSTPFGIAIVLLAMQMLLGRQAVWLPRKIKQVRIGAALADKMIGAAAKFMRAIEHLIRPRLRWVGSPVGRIATSSLILCMAALMILPIPLTNTFPAMVIFLIGIALTEEDGLTAMFGLLVACMAVALYSFIIYLAVTQGVEAVDSLKEMLKGFLFGQGQ